MCIRDSNIPDVQYGPNSMIYNIIIWGGADWDVNDMKDYWDCLLYTSDAADERSSVDLGGRRIIKKKTSQ